MSSATPHQPSKSTSQSRLPLYISLGIFALLLAAYFLIPAVQEFFREFWRAFTSGKAQTAEAWVAQFGHWGPVIVVVVMVVQMFLIVIPSPLLMVMSIMSFGAVWGSIILLIAVFCASSIGYLVGKYFNRDAQKLMGDKTLIKLTDFIDNYGFWAVIIIKFSPFLSNDAVSFVAGILKMGYWKFIGASMLGSLPLILIIAYLRRNYEIMGEGLLWVSIVSLLLLIAFIGWDKSRKKG